MTNDETKEWVQAQLKQMARTLRRASRESNGVSVSLRFKDVAFMTAYLETTEQAIKVSWNTKLAAPTVPTKKISEMSIEELNVFSEAIAERMDFLEPQPEETEE
jgi:hypothetical protein